MSKLLLIRYCNYVKLWTLKVAPGLTIEDVKKQIETKWHVPAITQCLSIKQSYDLPNGTKIHELSNNLNDKISIHLTLKKTNT
jgi:hypothetical protein